MPFSTLAAWAKPTRREIAGRTSAARGRSGQTQNVLTHAARTGARWNAFDQMEPRILLSSVYQGDSSQSAASEGAINVNQIADWAPGSLKGWSATLTVSSGTGVYASSGTFLWAFSTIVYGNFPVSHVYSLCLSGNGTDSFDTYDYTYDYINDSQTTETIRTYGGISTTSFVFTSAGGGSFSTTGPSGTQAGTFTIDTDPTGQAPYNLNHALFQFAITAGKRKLAPSGGYTLDAAKTDVTHK